MKRRNFTVGLLATLFSSEIPLIGAGDTEPQRSGGYFKSNPKTLVLDPQRDCYREFGLSPRTTGKRVGLSELFGRMGSMDSYRGGLRFNFVGEGCIGDLTYDKLRVFDIVSISTTDERIYSRGEIEAVKDFMRDGGLILLTDDHTRICLGGFMRGQFMEELGFVLKKYDKDHDDRSSGGCFEIKFHQPPGKYVPKELSERYTSTPGMAFPIRIQRDTSMFTENMDEVILNGAEPVEITNPDIAEPVLKPLERAPVVKVWDYFGHESVSNDIPSIDFTPQLPFIYFKLGRGEGIYVSRTIMGNNVYGNIMDWINDRCSKRG
jgi:hypothetical protein